MWFLKFCIGTKDLNMYLAMKLTLKALKNSVSQLSLILYAAVGRIKKSTRENYAVVGRIKKSTRRPSGLPDFVKGNTVKKLIKNERMG